MASYLKGMTPRSQAVVGLHPVFARWLDTPAALILVTNWIISSIYKITSFCKFSLESNSFPGLFLLMLFCI